MDYSKGNCRFITFPSLAESVAAPHFADHFIALFNSGDYGAGNPLTRDPIVSGACFQLVPAPPLENPQPKCP
jgi:hypothetical protein